MFRAVRNGAVLAESDRTVKLEGDHCFPAQSLRRAGMRPGARRRAGVLATRMPVLRAAAAEAAQCPGTSKVISQTAPENNQHARRN